ncbi:hypothetical protein NMY22_g13447 [Coprinellus aureogranulatus]|nr:hypothetical protein NMY22_g13447 [Coprinellus aureogranulatus]
MRRNRRRRFRDPPKRILPLITWILHQSRRHDAHCTAKGTDTAVLRFRAYRFAPPTLFGWGYQGQTQISPGTHSARDPPSPLRKKVTTVINFYNVRQSRNGMTSAPAGFHEFLVPSLLIPAVSTILPQDPPPISSVLSIMSFRIVSFIAWLYLFATLCASVGASPVPSDSNNSTVAHIEDLEKRVTRTGRVTWFNVVSGLEDRFRICFIQVLTVSFVVTGLGNCGKRSKDSDPVVAMGKAFYDRNKGSNCGQWVEIINTKTRKKAYGQLWDSCPGCSDSQLDVSPSLFQKFASLNDGVFTAEWHFMAKGWSP